MGQVSKTEDRLSKHDREIAAIRKLVLQGMKMLVRNQTQINNLTAAQARTEQTLERFIRSLDVPRTGTRNARARLLDPLSNCSRPIRRNSNT